MVSAGKASYDAGLGGELYAPWPKSKPHKPRISGDTIKTKEANVQSQQVLQCLQQCFQVTLDAASTHNKLSDFLPKQAPAGRVVVVFRRYMAGGLAHYLAVQALHLVTLAVCMGGSYAICARMPGGWLGLVPRVLVVLVVPNVLNLAVYGWGRDAAYLRSYAGKLAAKLKRKGKAE